MVALKSFGKYGPLAGRRVWCARLRAFAAALPKWARPRVQTTNMFAPGAVAVAVLLAWAGSADAQTVRFQPIGEVGNWPPSDNYAITEGPGAEVAFRLRRFDPGTFISHVSYSVSTTGEYFADDVIPNGDVSLPDLSGRNSFNLRAETVRLPLEDDDLYEPDGSITITAQWTGGEGSPQTRTVILRDDDPPVVGFSVTPTTITKGGNASFRIRRQGRDQASFDPAADAVWDQNTAALTVGITILRKV